MSKQKQQPLPKFLDLFQEQPMAILPAKMDEIQAFIDRRINGQLSDWQAVMPVSAQSEERVPYELREGVAIVPVRGVLAKRANLVTDFSGGTSMELLRADLLAADRDPAVRAILLHAESPGGTVDGCIETADTLWDVRSRKPVVTFVDGMMASACLWICSGAHSIITGPAAQCGSLGVLITHYDISMRDKAFGIVRTVIASGEYKSITSDEKPLSDRARAYLEDQVYTLFAMFTAGVARNRGMAIEAVLEKMGDGRVFIGADAVTAGAADAVGTFDDAFKAAQDMIKKGKFFNSPKKEDRSMKPEDVKTQFPETHAAIAEAATTAAIATAEISHKAALAEQKKNLIALVGAAFGPEAATKLQAMADAGVTVAQMQAMGIVGEAGAAGGVSRAQILSGLQAAASAPLSPATEQKPAAGTAPAPDFMVLVDAHMASAKCSKADAMKAVMQQHPAAHEAWLAKANQK